MRYLYTIIILLLQGTSSPANASPEQRNLVLLTLDGVRIQEIFTGMDPALAKASSMDEYSDIKTASERYWREKPRERREALMPFFWKKLVPLGQLYGNKSFGNRVMVTNNIKWSTPGYAEILTGRAQPEVIDNSLKRYSFETILDFIHHRKRLGYTDVALFGSWEGFEYIASSKDKAFFMNSGIELVEKGYTNSELELLGHIRQEVMELWEESSNDAITFRMALNFMESRNPRVLWIALGQSDDWSHANRYDRLVEYLHLADKWIGELWSFLQTHPFYKDKTNLVITTDHGRGLTPEDWQEHDNTIPGSEDIWLGLFGPGIPAAGELKTPGLIYQTNIAATILQLLGLRYKDYNPDTGKPLSLKGDQPANFR